MSDKIELFRQATELRNQRRYVEVREIYQRILAAFGPDSAVMVALAWAEYAISVVSEGVDEIHGRNAIRWVEQAIASRPDQADYYYTWGILLEHVGVPNYAAAARAYRRAVELEPYHVPALSMMATLCGVPEDVVPVEEAILCGERAVRAEPTRSRWIVLSRLYRFAGCLEDSERALINGLLEVHEAQPIRY
ncbi:MAG: hypothetical protein WCF84_27425 [Anaerolineae bacterium]